MKIRISCASICKILISNKYLLGLNKNKLSKGMKILTPLGGAFEIHPAGKIYLKTLDAEFEKKNDLRFMIDEIKIPLFEEWFSKRIQRETSPLRELEEELIQEYGVIKHLKPINITYLYTAFNQDITKRTGQEGKLTKRFLEIFDIQLNVDNIKEIRSFCLSENSPLVLVTETEIKKGISNSEIEISDINMCLINKSH